MFRTAALAMAFAVSLVVTAAPASQAQPPTETVYDLAEFLEALDLPKGIGTSLLVKAEAAIDAYERHWPARLDVVNHLSALAAEVRAQTGKGIPPPTAAILQAVIAGLVEHLGTPIVTCALPGGVTFSSTIEACGDAGGAVQECVPPGQARSQGQARHAPAIALVNYTATDPFGNMSDWQTNLTNDVDASNVTGRKFQRGTYMCADFAEDLQKNLTGKGYNTSFTIVYKKDANGRILSGHAVVDVKAPDGTVTFVEPQNGDLLDLDFDGDGKVETASGHPSGPSGTWPMTDDDARIEVYPNRQAARQAGLPV